MTDFVAAAACRSCDWEKKVTQPEAGQSLFGTLATYMNQHTARTGHETKLDWSDHEDHALV